MEFGRIAFLARQRLRVSGMSPSRRGLAERMLVPAAPCGGTEPRCPQSALCPASHRHKFNPGFGAQRMSTGLETNQAEWKISGPLCEIYHGAIRTGADGLPRRRRSRTSGH
ncbi:hypothetical protein AAFF_G00230200 [Aldrovandia affinis]|uniref:Uncharacterized protein n=1 Tax=Aldrovandia affinis TaxID=143900 RepID=A0AAD7WVA7_9TELE|nr:hypothetical protein AAFF_G00230200 [Aldrovandia affinis]